jgi:xanthine dehydrogenase YagR molybdenum-binding subunit
MIGLPIDRIDGPLKVTGRATYEYDDWSLGQPLYGFIVGATIGHGRVTRIDTSRAEQARGVRRVMTWRDAGGQHAPEKPLFDRYEEAYPVMASADVKCFGDPIALVVADTYEQARAAGALVDATYETKPAHYDLNARIAHAYTPKSVNADFPVDSLVGEFDAGFAGAPEKIDVLYTTPYEFSLPLEMHCCLAKWTGDRLHVNVSTQIVKSARLRIAATFGIDPEKVSVASRYVGGGFGSKLGVHAETILAILAARVLKQPVKIMLTRQQVFTLIGNRPATIQRVRLGAKSDGTLLAYGHDVTMKASYGDNYIEQTATVGRPLYAAPHRRSVHRAVDLHLVRSEDVRAPGETPGLNAVEAAMDELAHALKIDPVELRIKNEPKVHPETGLPFSERRLVECLREGAQRFGWDRRPKTPASVHDGRRFVGYGMAAAIRPHFQGETTVRVKLDPDGIAVVQSDMTDIGTGTYTILAQVAAECLGLPIDRVRVELGSSEFPKSSGSGGSWGATNSTTSAYRACRELRERLAHAAVADGPLQGRDAKTAVFADGKIVIGDAAESLTALLARKFPSGIDALGSVGNMLEDPKLMAYSMSTYGAHFAEVRVDADTGEIRLVRMLGVFDPGRVLNAKTARSQLLGGMIWGVSSVLHEEGVVDTRYGSFINRDFAQYLVPVHADVPNIEAIFLDAFDDKANELGAKGLGELGICGAGAAVANAVFNATGVRVREYPITVEKLLPHLPRSGVTL